MPRLSEVTSQTAGHPKLVTESRISCSEGSVGAGCAWPPTRRLRDPARVIWSLCALVSSFGKSEIRVSRTNLSGLVDSPCLSFLVCKMDRLEDGACSAQSLAHNEGFSCVLSTPAPPKVPLNRLPSVPGRRVLQGCVRDRPGACTHRVRVCAASLQGSGWSQSAP